LNYKLLVKAIRDLDEPVNSIMLADNLNFSKQHAARLLRSAAYIDVIVKCHVQARVQFYKVHDMACNHFEKSDINNANNSCEEELDEIENKIMTIVLSLHRHATTFRVIQNRHSMRHYGDKTIRTALNKMIEKRILIKVPNINGFETDLRKSCYGLASHYNYPKVVKQE